MYAVVRRYPHIKVAEACARAEAGLTDLLHDSPGFLGYYAVDAGDGIGMTISLYDSPAAGAAAGMRALAWVRENMADLYEGEPQITAGPVVMSVKP